MLKKFSQEDFALRSKLWPNNFSEHRLSWFFFSRNKGQLRAAVTRPCRLSTTLCHTYSEPSVFVFAKVGYQIYIHVCVLCVLFCLCVFSFSKLVICEYVPLSSPKQGIRHIFMCLVCFFLCVCVFVFDKVGYLCMCLYQSEVSVGVCVFVFARVEYQTGIPCVCLLCVCPGQSRLSVYVCLCVCQSGVSDGSEAASFCHRLSHPWPLGNQKSISGTAIAAIGPISDGRSCHFKTRRVNASYDLYLCSLLYLHLGAGPRASIHME